MKSLITAVCFLSLASGASAFDLPVLNAGALRGAPAPQVPAASPNRGLEDDMIHGAIPAGAPGWAELRSAFFEAEPVKDLDSLIGVYSGSLHPLYEREDFAVPFGVSIYRGASGEVLADFPMPPNGEFETVKLKLTKQGAEFDGAWGGRARLVIRQSGGKLCIFSNLYSDETYGEAEKMYAEPWDPGQDFRGEKGTGRLLATSYSRTSGQVTAISPDLFVMEGEVFSYYTAKFSKKTVSGPLWFDKRDVRFENLRVLAGGQAIADCRPDGKIRPGFKCALRQGVGIAVKPLQDGDSTFVLVKK